MSSGSKWNLYTYVVWGNAEDGYTVNDLFPKGLREFSHADPTDHDFVCDATGRIDGGDAVGVDTGASDENTVYLVRLSDWMPLCEYRKVE
jgi:hypothetical protein